MSRLLDKMFNLYFYLKTRFLCGRYFSGGILYDPNTKQVLLHLRDNNTRINPNKWAFFGGLNEAEDGNDPTLTWIREMKEELAVELQPDQVKSLFSYYNRIQRTYRYVFAAASTLPKSAMKLSEGADFEWFDIEEAFTKDLTEFARQDLLRAKKILF